MGTMDILVIDDLRNFQFPAVYARNVDDGIFWLESRGWKEVWLDHDLGGDETIRPVVEVMEERAYHGKPFDIDLCVIHTSNPVGRQYIDSALRKWYTTVSRDAGIWLAFPC